MSMYMIEDGATDNSFRGWTNGWEKLPVAPAPKPAFYAWAFDPIDAYLEILGLRNRVDWTKGTCRTDVGLGKLIAEG